MLAMCAPEILDQRYLARAIAQVGVYVGKHVGDGRGDRRRNEKIDKQPEMGRRNQPDEP
jgi:hypothetical protein